MYKRHHWQQWIQIHAKDALCLASLFNVAVDLVTAESNLTDIATIFRVQLWGDPTDADDHQLASSCRCLKAKNGDAISYCSGGCSTHFPGWSRFWNDWLFQILRLFDHKHRSRSKEVESSWGRVRADFIHLQACVWSLSRLVLLADERRLRRTLHHRRADPVRCAELKRRDHTVHSFSTSNLNLNAPLVSQGCTFLHQLNFACPLMT